MNPGELKHILNQYGYVLKVEWIGYSVFVPYRRDSVDKTLVCGALEMAGIRAKIGAPQYPMERNGPLCLIVHHP